MTGKFSEITASFRHQGDSTTVQYDQSAVLWSVNGGHIAATKLLLANERSQFQRPTSISVDYFRPLKTTPYDATIRTTHTSNSAELLDIEFHDGGVPHTRGSVWTLAGSEGPSHYNHSMPLVPAPRELRRIEEILEPGESPVLGFWDFCEQRPIARSVSRGPRSARMFRWFKFHDTDFAQSPARSLARTLPIIDLMGIPSVAQLSSAPFLTSLAPTIHLQATFYDDARGDEWLLSDSRCEHASDGLITTTVIVWGESGKLIADGRTSMVVKSKRKEGAYVSQPKPQDSQRLK